MSVLGSSEAILVIGGGAAAFSAIAAYREAGGARPVVMLSDDDRLPYFRPAVSKEYLVGEQSADEIGLADMWWFNDNDVDVHIGQRVTSIDAGARRVTTTAEDARWARCIVATGSTPGALPAPGAQDDRVLTIRSAGDTERLLERVGVSGSIVIVGSGFIGCEVAAGLAGRGNAVTMVSQERLPQLDRLGVAVGELIAGRLRDLGVDLVLETEVASVDHGATGVRLALVDHSPVEADHVLVAVGAQPRLELLEPLGLVADRSVEVTSTMATKVDGVFAIGDIAAAWNETAGRRLRVEHWGDAEGHGKVVGAHLAGGHARWADVPGFWSTIGGMTLKYVAWGDGHDAVHVDRSDGGTTVWYGRDGVVVGVLTHEHDEDFEVAERAVAERRPMP